MHASTHHTLLTMVLLFVCIRFTSADPQTERVRTVAAENSAALTSGNFARLVELTYSKVVEMIGGRDKMVEMLRSGLDDMKAHGSAILGAEVSEPKEVVTAGEKQFAIVPMVVRIQVPEGILRSKAFLIAVSEDHGNTWKFIDGAGLHNTSGRRGKHSNRLFRVFLPSFLCQLGSRPCLNANET